MTLYFVQAFIYLVAAVIAVMAMRQAREAGHPHLKVMPTICNKRTRRYDKTAPPP